MNLLQRYILSQFVKNIFTILACLITVYLLIDFFQKIDNFSEKNQPMAVVFKFFLFSIPFILSQMSPVCILLAGVVTLGILNSSNELIALKASGIPLRQIIMPILVAGLVIVLLFLAMTQFVLPKTIAATNKIWHEKVMGRVVLGIYRNGRYYYHGKEGYYSFSRPRLDQNEFLQFSYSTRDVKHRLSSLIAAQSASYEDGTWLLRGGQVQRRTSSGDYRTEIFSDLKIQLPDKPSDFFIPEHRAQGLSLVELYRETQHQGSKEETSRAWADFYERLSYPLLGLPLLVLGLPLLLIVYRKWGRDLSLAIPVSCGMAFVCWGIWGTLQSLARTGYVEPWLAAASVHLVVGVIGFYLLFKEDY